MLEEINDVYMQLAVPVHSYRKNLRTLMVILDNTHPQGQSPPGLSCHWNQMSSRTPSQRLLSPR